jgi:uncharacterized protein with PIN domain
VNGKERPFGYIVVEKDRIEVHGPPRPLDPTETTLLRPGIPKVRFAVDVNVGKLAGLLRMAGFDTFYDPEGDDGELAEISATQERILLTRDHSLLKRKKVVHGRLIRHEAPVEQLREVVGLYGLQERLEPFSRCLRCNERLEVVSKEAVIDRLEPLTRKYYDDFRICPGCNRLYWAGSHREKMQKIIEEL